MAKIPGYENFIHDIAMKALEYEFEGKTLREWIDILKDYQSSKWISVEERLPEKDVKVLCLFKYPESQTVCENVYYGGGYWLSAYSNVTHWMPLPEPPKEGTHEPR